MRSFPAKRDYSVSTYLRISTVPRGSEQSEWASPWTERASKASVAKRSKAERCGASERCEWMNVASDRVARSKRSCLWLETTPMTNIFFPFFAFCHKFSSILIIFLLPYHLYAWRAGLLNAANKQKEEEINNIDEKIKGKYRKKERK